MTHISDVFDPVIVEMLASYQGEEVFDYGCGHGQISVQLVRLGKKVTAFDVSDVLIRKNRFRDVKINITYLSTKEFNVNDLLRRFPLVLCSLVLCIVEDDNEFREILKNINLLLDTDGIAMFSICNPLAFNILETSIQTRHILPGSDYNDKFVYKKTIKSTGGCREDVHRPLGFYESEFNKAKLKIKRIDQVPNPGEIYSDFMIITTEKVGDYE